MNEQIEIRAEGVNVAEIMAKIRENINKKRESGLLTDDDIEELAQIKLEKIAKATDLDDEILKEFHRTHPQWNIQVHHRITTHRKLIGKLFVWVKSHIILPLIRFFVEFTEENFRRQNWLNFYYAHIIHNLVYEVTRMEIEMQKLRHNLLHLQQDHEFLKKREKCLEELTFEKKQGKKE